MAKKRTKKATLTQPRYEVVGLAMQEQMPMVIGGESYDLARLTDAQIDRLKARPKPCRYLRWIDETVIRE